MPGRRAPGDAFVSGCRSSAVLAPASCLGLARPGGSWSNGCVDDISDNVRRLFPAWRVRSAMTLRGGQRAVVQRLAVVDERDRPGSVIAKLFGAAGD